MKMWRSSKRARFYMADRGKDSRSSLVDRKVVPGNIVISYKDFHLFEYVLIIRMNRAIYK